MATQTLVHLDFKGLALSPAFLCDSLLPLLAKCGATGILLEWEDMLPFDGELEALRSPSAFTVAEVAQVLACMASLGLEAIPLVQTLGHCEYILKHEQFAHLREDVDDYGTLCPKVAQAAVAALLTPETSEASSMASSLGASPLTSPIPSPENSGDGIEGTQPLPAAQ